MVETIAPVVHGGKRLRYLVSIALHTLGATVAAAALGATLGGLGGLVEAPWGGAGWALLAAVAVVYALREGAGLPVPLPDARRQVPEWWRRFFSPHISATLYGLGLGIAYYTHLSFGTFVVVSGAALVSGDPLIGAVVCAPFGLSRALAVALNARTHDAQGPAGLVMRLEDIASTRGPRAVNAVAIVAMGAAALAAI